ncbi:twin-arginine translocation signal domain-containing protein [bacterium]|nr:MAG: twin-arginine translocation signal domain-containing protein [bacterium]
MKKDSIPEKGASRRQFLQNATVAASVAGGSLILGRAAQAQVGFGGIGAEPAAEPAGAANTDTVLKLSEHEALQKVGGFEIIEVGGQKVIVAHTEAGYAACSAVCPHKGCDVEYRAEQKDFYCPCHRSRFDESGKVLAGPAKTDLAPFAADQALTIHSK